MRRLKWLVISFLFMMGGFFSCQVWIYFQLANENEELQDLLVSYEKLVEEIEMYKSLQEYYLLELETESDLNNNLKGMQDKVNVLQQEVIELQGKISDVNEKIKSLS